MRRELIILDVFVLLFVGVVAAIVLVIVLSRLWRFASDMVRGAEAWARHQRELRDQTQSHGFPVQPIDQPDGPGIYRLSGVIRQTEEEVEWQIDAQTRANAIAKAELRGMLVTKVEKISEAVKPAAGADEAA